MIQETANAKKLLRFLSHSKSRISPLLILTHDYPDPDTLASAFALKYLAQTVYGIESKIVYGGVIGRMENREMVRTLQIPIHKIKNSDFRRYEHIALLDTQPEFANNPFPKNRKATLVIDQHPSVTRPQAEFAIVDSECGAVSVILAQALLISKIDIPKNVATALAYGILSDTLNLYRACKTYIIQTYLEILHHGDLRALAKIQNPERSRSFFKTLAKGIQNATARRHLIISHLGLVDNPDLISQTADFLLAYRSMTWSLCTGRFRGKLHVSLRTESSNMQAGEVLRDVFLNRGEAGGHSNIAGGSFRVGKDASDEIWESAEAFIAERLLKRIRISFKKEAYYPFR